MNPLNITAAIIKSIADELWDSNSNNIEFEEFCGESIRKHWSKITEWQLLEILEPVQHKVRLEVKKKISECREKGVKPRYLFSEVSNTLYRVRDVKTDEIRLKIKSIDWNSFEHLCKHILEISGVTAPGVTKSSKEGGIDFYGLLRMGDYRQSILLSGLEIRIVGQAKHHSEDEKVGEPDMNAFIKQFEGFRDGKGRGFKAVPAWFRRARSPVTAIVITNTEFTDGAQTAARNAGVVIRDGEQIAEDLVRSPKVNELLGIC